MRDFKLARMQRLPWKRLQRLAQHDGQAGAAHRPAVDEVANDRLADMRHVHADLMCAAGFQTHAHVRVLLEAFLHPVVGDGRTTIVDHRHLQALARMAADRSEEHTSELQSLMSNSYAGFCLEK